MAAVDFASIEDILLTAHRQGRLSLYEHECYDLLSSTGAEAAPAHRLIAPGSRPTRADLEAISSDRVVLKVVSPDIVHKTEARGVRIVAREIGAVEATFELMRREVPEAFAGYLADRSGDRPAALVGLAGKGLRRRIADRIAGTLLCSFVEPDDRGFATELFVGIRTTDEFGPIISAGLGGVEMEVLARRSRPGAAIVIAPTGAVSGATFLELFRGTLSYERLSGRMRGSRRLVEDSILEECFQAFIDVANHFSVANPSARLHLVELEVNPFAISGGRLAPLDGVCSFGPAVAAPPPRPTAKIEQLLKPRSIAVVGASNRVGSVGRALFANILMNGFTGVVYPVNMTAKSVLGVKAYRTIYEVPDDIDLVVLMVPAVAVPAILAECGQKKVKGAIVISAGFKELGPTGAQLELAVADRARKYGIRLIGPNCFGIINCSPQVRLNTTFGRVMPRFGNIAFISQSGAVGVNALEYAESEELGFSKFISIGNKADVNECDLLRYLKDDEETDVIALYLEDLADPPRFMHIAREVASHETRPKPILAIKSGRTTEGARAASSHTGALAGSDAAYDAFFAQARILRVETINELFAKAAALAYQPVPKGARVAILTNAGGVGIMGTDACIRNGLEMAQLTPGTREELRKRLPVTASTGNPVDIIGDADEKRYRAALELMVADENVDGLIPMWTPTLMAEAVDIANVIADIGQKSDKPILACIQTMGNSADVRHALLRDHIPHYQFPENAARAMSAMAEFGTWSRRPQGEVRNFTDTNPEAVRAIIDRARSRQPLFISEPEGHDILRAYGLPVPASKLAKNLDEALAAAREIGYPVVLKIVSPDVLHKTEFGGVRINITDEAKLKAEHASLLAGVKAKWSAARDMTELSDNSDRVPSRTPVAHSACADRVSSPRIWGVLVQHMAPKGTETILGMNRDPHFGPILMFGLGGVMVEVLKDVTFRIAPLNDISTDSMVSGIKALKILQGFRGEAPRDVAKIKECLQRLSQLVTDFTDFSEIDINPLLVYEEGKGALVLDARFLLGPASPAKQ